MRTIFATGVEREISSWPTPTQVSLINGEVAETTTAVLKAVKHTYRSDSEAHAKFDGMNARLIMLRYRSGWI